MSYLTDLLDNAGVEYHSTSEDDEVTIQCPYCEGSTVQGRFTFGLNVSNGKAHCYRCGWKSAGILDTAKKLADSFGVGLSRVKHRQSQTTGDVPEKVPDKKAEAVGFPEEYEALLGARDIVARRARKYLESRGVTTLQIVSHKIGFAAWGKLSWRVLFPVIGEDDKVYGCVGRALTPKQDPKYLNTSGIKLMWNAYRRGKIAVVTEGIMDALSVERAINNTPEMVSVARLGSTITKLQLEQLQSFEEVLILPDWDKPGCMGAIDLGNHCLEAGLSVKVSIPHVMDGRDPGAMVSQQILEVIQCARRYNSTAARLLKLACTREVD